MTIEELQNLRIGFVLAGGGAKGAYQVGCWKALRDRGITRIDALAGASVGALNAILMAVGKYDSALSLWTGLRFTTVLGLKTRKAFLLPIWLVVSLYRAMNVPVRDSDREGREIRRVTLLWVSAVLLFAFPHIYATQWPYIRMFSL
jgi:hypothetical protein